MLQEQLAAEFISDTYSPAEATQLFTEQVGDPRWSQVILATMWRLKRPAELRAAHGGAQQVHRRHSCRLARP